MPVNATHRVEANFVADPLPDSVHLAAATGPTVAIHARVAKGPRRGSCRVRVSPPSNIAHIPTFPPSSTLNIHIAYITYT